MIPIFLRRKTGPKVKYLLKATEIESGRSTACGPHRKCLLEQLHTSGLGKRLWGERGEPLRAGGGRGERGERREVREGTAAGELDQGLWVKADFLTDVQPG